MSPHDQIKETLWDLFDRLQSNEVKAGVLAAIAIVTLDKKQIDKLKSEDK